MISCVTTNPLQVEVDQLNTEKGELTARLEQMQISLSALAEELDALRDKSSVSPELDSETQKAIIRDRDSLRLRSTQLESNLLDLRTQLLNLRTELDRVTTAKVPADTQREDLLQKRIQELSNQVAFLTNELKVDQERMADAAEALKRSLETEIIKGDLEIIQYSNVLVVNIKDRVLFDPESPLLNPAYEFILAKVAQAFLQFPDKVIRVEGHTAVYPSQRWSSSWDLGASRAVSVVRFFQEKAGIDPTRLVALSFGEYRPVEGNSNSTQRAQNRRVQLVLVDRPFYEIQEILKNKP